LQPGSKAERIDNTGIAENKTGKRK